MCASQVMFVRCFETVKQCIRVHSTFPNGRVMYGDAKLILFPFTTLLLHIQPDCCSCWDYKHCFTCAAYLLTGKSEQKKKEKLCPRFNEFSKQNAKYSFNPDTFSRHIPQFGERPQHAQLVAFTSTLPRSGIFELITFILA